MTTESIIPTTKKLILLNASSLSKLICRRKYFWNVLIGYSEKETYNDTWFGSCYHEFRKQVALTGGNFPQALKLAGEMWKSKTLSIRSRKDYINESFLRVACSASMEHFEFDDFKTLIEGGKPMVELQFHLPFYSDEYIEVVLVATLDDIGKIDGGAYCIRDYKTTATWKMDEFLFKYRLSAQMMFYYLILKLQAERLPDSIYGTIFKKGKVGVIVDGLFIKPDETAFKRMNPILFPSEKDMEELTNQLHDLCFDLSFQWKSYIETDIIPNRQGLLNGSCMYSYGSVCEFFDACSAPDEAIANHVLKNNFLTKEWGMETYGGQE